MSRRKEQRAEVLRRAIHAARNGAVNGLKGSPGAADVVRVAWSKYGLIVSETEAYEALLDWH